MVYGRQQRAAPVVTSSAQPVGSNRIRIHSHKRAEDDTSCTSGMDSAFLSHLMGSGGPLHNHFTSTAAAPDGTPSEGNLEGLSATLLYSDADLMHPCSSSSVFNGGLLLSHPGSSPASSSGFVTPPPPALVASVSSQPDADRCAQLERELADAHVTIERLCEEVLQEHERCMALQEEVDEQRADAVELARLRAENLELKRRINYLAAAPGSPAPFPAGPALQCATVRPPPSSSASPASSPRPPSTTGHSSVEPPLTPATLGRSPKPPRPLTITTTLGEPPTSFSPSTDSYSTPPTSRQSSLTSPTALPCRPTTVHQFGWPAQPPPSLPASPPASPPALTLSPPVIPDPTPPPAPPSIPPSPATSEPPSPAPCIPDAAPPTDPPVPLPLAPPIHPHPPSLLPPVQPPMGLLLLPAARTLSRAAALLAQRSLKLLLPDPSPNPPVAAPAPTPARPPSTLSSSTGCSTPSPRTSTGASMAGDINNNSINVRDPGSTTASKGGPCPHEQGARACAPGAAAGDVAAASFGSGSMSAGTAAANDGGERPPYASAGTQPPAAGATPASEPGAMARPHGGPPPAPSHPAASPPLTPVIGRPCDDCLAPQPFNQLLLFDPRAGAATPTPGLAASPPPAAAATAAASPLQPVPWGVADVRLIGSLAGPGSPPAHSPSPPSPLFTALPPPFAPTPDTPSMSISLTDTPSYTRPPGRDATPTSSCLTPPPQRPPPAALTIQGSLRASAPLSLPPVTTTLPLPSPRPTSSPSSPRAPNPPPFPTPTACAAAAAATTTTTTTSTAHPAPSPNPSPPPSQPTSPDLSPRAMSTRTPLNLAIFAQISASMSGVSSTGASSPPAGALPFSRSSSHASLHDFRIDRIHPAPPSFDPPFLDAARSDSFTLSSPFVRGPPPTLTARSPRFAADATPYPTYPTSSPSDAAGSPPGSPLASAATSPADPPSPPHLLLLECPSLVDVCRLPSTARRAPTISWWGRGGYFSESKQQELQQRRATAAAARKQAKSAATAAVAGRGCGWAS